MTLKMQKRTQTESDVIAPCAPRTYLHVFEVAFNNHTQALAVGINLAVTFQAHQPKPSMNANLLELFQPRGTYYQSPHKPARSPATTGRAYPDEFRISLSGTWLVRRVLV